MKRSGSAVQDTVFRMLGDGVGPVDLHLGRPLKNAVDTFSLALTAQGFPIVWFGAIRSRSITPMSSSWLPQEGCTVSPPAWRTARAAPVC
ncbi:hypothetical protein [Stigmatella aurantiaca]|nr:hypothetical protein [Stigmatella aurantiaca]